MGVDRKYERDIDMMLAEEFIVSPAFADWFVDRTTRFAGSKARVADVYVSRADNTGESDLLVLFERFNDPSTESVGRFALFIEDKIDAPLQPEQEARYRIRAEAGIARGDYSEYSVILCSPEACPLTHPEVASFDTHVSYETIASFLRSRDEADRRNIYRADFFSTAATKRSNAWEPTRDAVTDAFWRAAYSIAIKEFPDLEMREPAFTQGQTWIDFYPLEMHTHPRRMYVGVKGGLGCVDLTFKGCIARLLLPAVQPILEDGMTVHQTGRSAAIRLQVERYAVAEPDDAAMSKVRNAFRSASRLIRFHREHRDILYRAALDSRPSQMPKLRAPRAKHVA